MIEIVLSALVLGFSTGLTCLATCAPFYLPYLIAEERKLKINFWQLIQLMLGRLTGYLSFGLLVSLAGQKLNVGWINTLSTVSLGLLAGFLILYSLNFFQTKLHPWLCRFQSARVKPPFLIGLLTGLNFCPPFLISLNYLFVLGNPQAGIIYFLVFFLATNLYFLPLIFLGKLSFLKEFRSFARFTLLAIGIIFFVYVIYHLINQQQLLHLSL